MSAVYPTIEDWDAYVRGYLPAPAAIGASEDYAQALAWPWSVIDADLLALVSGLVDLGAAVGWVLDVAGAEVREPRGGLSDTEYRRIIAGRRLALGSTGSTADAWAVLVALAGSEDGAIWLLHGPGGVSAAVWMQMRVTFSPSAGYLLRAGAVMRDALPADADAVVTVYTTPALFFDGPGVFDSGVFAYNLPV